MQAQIELFSVEHTDIKPETAEFLRLLQEQTERMSQMTNTLLEMSELRNIKCSDKIQLAPMTDEVFADLAPIADEKNVSLTRDGDALIIGSDTLIYRMIFNLTENAVRYTRRDSVINISIVCNENDVQIRVRDNGHGIPEQYRESISSRFSVLTRRAAESTAEWVSGLRSYGKLPRFTAVPSESKIPRKPAR